MENKKHTLLCIIGRTACGKDSLVNKLCERTGLKAITSYTTRPRRENEGDAHIFVSEDDYEQMYQAGIVAAFTQIGEYKYWTTIDQLEKADIYIIDYEGIKTLRDLNLSSIHIITVFINTPDDIREERAIKNRKDNKMVFRKRNLNEAPQFREMLRNADFDYAISNIDFAKAYSTLRWIATIEGVWKNNVEDTTE